MYRVLLASASIVSLVFTTPAPAQASSEKRPSFVVHYADLDVNRSDGARVLLGRLRHAAKLVCGPSPDNRDLDQIASFTACVKVSMDHAVADVHAPLVTALYAGPETIAQN